MASDPFQPLLSRFRRSGVIAVVVIDDPDQSVPLVEALTAGGVDLLELTLRTPSAVESMRRIRRAFPSIGLGAGTVLRPDQVIEVKEAGADFGVAPGLNPRVVHAAQQAGLPFAPGVRTPSEIEQAVELGCHVLKFFPAAADGGTRTFEIVTSPYAHLGLQFIPLGGLNASLAGAFLRLPAVVALGGSWIAPRELIRAGDWPTIQAHAAAITELVQCIRKAD